MKKVKLTMDGIKVAVPKGSTILDAAKIAKIDIPTLCYHEGLSVGGGCRLCLVEVEGEEKLVTACTYLVREGIKVKTKSKRIYEARKKILELLFSDHPKSCMICESSGDCKLEQYAYEYQIDPYHFRGEEHSYPIETINPCIEIDYNKCIGCELCVKICEEMQGRSALAFVRRGFDIKISTPYEKKLEDANCEFCGQCVAVCPSGALIEKQRKGKGREWELKKITTICPYCGCGCTIDLNVKDNQLVKVTSNEGFGVNGIALCVKGRFGLDWVNREERLKSPLIKRGGKFEEASWEEALKLIAKRFLEIKQLYGSNSIGVLGSTECTNEENFLLQKFARACLGTTNIDNSGRLCHSPSMVGLKKAFGVGAMTNSIAELEDTEVILVIGSNLTESYPIISLKIKKALKKGAKLILIDPRNTELSEIATLYLQLKPGSDVALLNAMMWVILKEGLWKKEFVERRCENFKKFKKTIEKYTPKGVERITGIGAEKICEAARIYGKAKKAAILFSMGITQHTTGTDNVLSITNLAMLTGNVGKESAGVYPIRGSNNVQGACDMGLLPNFLPGYQSIKTERAKFERRWGVSLADKSGLTATELIDSAHKRELKALYIVGENPMVSFPVIAHVKEGLEKLEFLVVQDLFLSETAQLANVILPVASFAEKDGTFTNTERRVQRIRKAIEPIGKSKADWEIIQELSKKMNYPMDYSIPSQIFKEIAELVPIYKGISYRRLKREGIQWPCLDKSQFGTKFLHKGKFARGKGRFYPIEYKEPRELPNKEYPFLLTTGRLLYQFHTGTMTRKSQDLEEICPKGYIEINPADAKALAIKDGEELKVSSKRGSINIDSKVTEKVPKALVFIPFHFAEAAANVLTNPALDPIAKIPEYKVCAVRLEKLPRF